MKRPEQIACLLAALVALASLAGYPPGVKLERPTGSDAATGAQTESDRSPLPVAEVLHASVPAHGWQWDVPLAQTNVSRGGGDLFTAPLLERDAATGRLRIRAPDAGAAEDNVAFGLSLVEVVREPFRLQLVGYAADDGAWIGVFENRITGRVFLARASQDVPELDLRIESLVVERRRNDVPGTGTVAGRVAVARVLDRTDGTAVELSSATRRTVGRPRARFRDVVRGEIFDASSGGEFAVDGVTFRVAAITGERVQVSRLQPGAPAEHRWVHIATAATGSP